MRGVQYNPPPHPPSNCFLRLKPHYTPTDLCLHLLKQPRELSNKKFNFKEFENNLRASRVNFEFSRQRDICVSFEYLPPPPYNKITPLESNLRTPY